MKKILYEKFKQQIIEYLASEYNYDIDSAKNMVEDSSLKTLFEKDVEVVLHYSIPYWANDIRTEYEELKKFALVG